MRVRGVEQWQGVRRLRRLAWRLSGRVGLAGLGGAPRRLGRRCCRPAGRSRAGAGGRRLGQHRCRGGAPAARGLCRGHRRSGGGRGDPLQLPSPHRAWPTWNGPAATISSVVLDWTPDRGRRQRAGLRRRLAAAPRRTARWTSISAAIDAAVPLFDGNGYAGDRRVIDVSGDGPNNRGRPVTAPATSAVAQGIVINGLPILNDRPQPFDLPTPMDMGLDRYYAEHVIGGPGSFVAAGEGLHRLPHRDPEQADPRDRRRRPPPILRPALGCSHDPDRRRVRGAGDRGRALCRPARLSGRARSSPGEVNVRLPYRDRAPAARRHRVRPGHDGAGRHHALWRRAVADRPGRARGHHRPQHPFPRQGRGPATSWRAVGSCGWGGCWRWARSTIVAAEGGEPVAHAIGTYAIPPARSVDSGGATA